MTSSQRIAAVVALVVGLLAVGYSALPMSGGCGPAAVEAFRRQHQQGNPFDGGTWGRSCRTSARSRLQTSGTVVALDLVGLAVTWRLLRPESDVERVAPSGPGERDAERSRVP